MLQNLYVRLGFLGNQPLRTRSSCSKISWMLQKDKVTSRHNIRPIEVKSGKNYTLSSLTKCMKKFGEYMTTPTILHAADYKVEGDVTYLPLYMTPLL